MKILFLDYDGISFPIFTWFMKDKAEIQHSLILNKSAEKLDLSVYNKTASYITEEQLLPEYDLVFCFFDPIKLIDEHMYSKWLPSGSDAVFEKSSITIDDYHNRVYSILKMLDKVKTNKTILVDTDDRARYKREAIDCLKNKFKFFPNLVLKTEYRITYEYSYKDLPVKSFQFTTFHSDKIKELYIDTCSDNVFTRMNKCCYIGSMQTRLDLGLRDEWVNRFYMIKGLEKVDPELRLISQMDRPLYLEEYKKYRMFLHLNGAGHKCHRFFEGMSRGGLMIQEEMENVFPFDFHPLTVFSHPEEYKKKMDKLKSDIWIFKEALDHQKKYLTDYYNSNYISNYIIKSLE